MVANIGENKNLVRVAEFESRAHRHVLSAVDEHQICLVLESDGGLLRQERNGIVFEGTRRAGDIDIIPAFSSGQCHSQARQKFIAVQLPSAVWARVSRDMGASDEALQPTTRFAMRDEHLKSLILLLHAETRECQDASQGENQKKTPDPSGDLMLDSLTTALAIQLLRHHAHARSHVLMQEPTCATCGGLSDKAQQQVLQYVEENLENSINLDDVAAVAGLSRFHFLRAFKDSFGLTPHQYLLEQRVQHAQKLMEQPRLTLREISQLCGFSDQSHLTRHFRRLTGVTPKVFGDALRNGSKK